jgi:hypothetical protein
MYALDSTGVEQDAFGRRRFARVDVRRNANVSNP